MADSFNKKDREKKRRKKKLEKAEKKEQKKLEGKSEPEFMYVDEFGNLTPEPPDPSKRQEVNVEDIEVSIPKKEEVEYDPIRKGSVKFFNNEKGYGFINDTETQESYFVHIDGCVDPIGDGDKVSFEIGSGHKGPIALKVQLIKS